MKAALLIEVGTCMLHGLFIWIPLSSLLKFEAFMKYALKTYGNSE